MNGNNICSIICGSPDSRLDSSLVEGLVICADSGLDNALKAGIKPNIVVGDFDSCTAQIPDDAEIIRVSPIKDDTDTILAADIAIERGCSELRFFCATGGRFDHTYANVQMLEYLHNKDVSAVLYGGSETIRLLYEGECTSLHKHNGFVSVFALTENALISEQGMKYPLDHHILERCFPLGISNEITADIGQITVHSGIVILCEYKC